MTPSDFVAEIESLSDSDDPDGLLAYAESHLAEVTPPLELEQTIRVNEFGHWAVMVVSLREFSEREASATKAD